MNQPIYYILL